MCHHNSSGAKTGYVACRERTGGTQIFLGELNETDQPYYTKNGINNAPSNRGFNLPYGVAIDSVTHRLFVAEYSNNRVVIYNLNSSNNVVSRVASNVLVRANMNSNAPLPPKAG